MKTTTEKKLDRLYEREFIYAAKLEVITSRIRTLESLLNSPKKLI